MDEYISKDEVVEVITRVEGAIIRRALNRPVDNGCHAKITEQLSNMITKIREGIATADVVEVVRCRDCRYRESNLTCQILISGKSADEHYCSYGERKEEDKQ